MQDTGTNYVGMKDGRAVAIATRFTGAGADEANAETVRDMEARGETVEVHPRAVACDMHIAAIGGPPRRMAAVDPVQPSLFQ